MTSQAKQMATQRERGFVRAAAVHLSGGPMWSRKRHSYPDNQPRSSKTAKPPTFSRFSPDLTQPRRKEGSNASLLDDSARTDSANERYGTESRVHPPAEQPQHQIRITSQGGVISVENMPGQNRSSSPMTACEKPKSPQAPQGETTNGCPGRETGQTGQSTSAVVDEIPDLSEYARAFNITDIDERDLDEGMAVSEDGSDTHEGEPKTNASGHVACPCSNPFCCGSLSRNRLDKFLGSDKREKRFPCRFCGRRFAHLSTLQNHVRVHTGDRPYQCKYCGKCFAQSGVLKTHLRTHTGDKPFQCPFCGRFFAQSTTLTNHLRIHTGHKPFVCKHCSKAFSQPSTLRKHEISHTDQRPYQCKVCGRAFVQQSTLNNHMRSHTGQKPYKCPFCGRGFAQLSTMDRHLKIHTSFRYKPHQCPYCDKDFSYLSNLTNHLQTHTQPLPVLS